MIVVAGAIAIMTSCSSVDCPVENIVATVCTLYRADGTADTLRSDTLTIVSPRLNGNDTTLLNRGIGIHTFQLPMSYSNATDTLYLILADTVETNHRLYFDTIYITKTNQPHFESVDCNLSFFHEITDIKHTHNRLDSIVINKSTVDYDLTNDHLRMYFKKP